MPADVSSQVALLGESLRAQGAFERPLPGVHPNMRGERAAPRESLVAHRAFVGATPPVVFHMPFEGLQLGKGLHADGALIWRGSVWATSVDH